MAKQSWKINLIKITLTRSKPPLCDKYKKGCIVSLLEVGTGFQLELTGCENIFLNGAILGMTKSEIKSKFDEIVDMPRVDKSKNHYIVKIIKVRLI